MHRSRLHARWHPPDHQITRRKTALIGKSPANSNAPRTSVHGAFELGTALKGKEKPLLGRNFAVENRQRDLTLRVNQTAQLLFLNVRTDASANLSALGLDSRS